VKDASRVEAGQKLVEWDPYSLLILTEAGGKVAYGDIVEGVTMKEELDEVTGLSRKVVIEHPGATLRPRISIKDESGKTAKISNGQRSPATYCRSARTSSWKRGRWCIRATSWPKSPVRRRRRRTSREASREWPSCSKREDPKSRR